MRIAKTTPRREGAREIAVAPDVIDAARREQPLLGGLMAVAAGFCPSGSGSELPRRSVSHDQALIAYCVKGAAWCDIQGHLHTFRKGGLLIVPPTNRCTLGPRGSASPALHWVCAAGPRLTDYLQQLGVSSGAVVLPIGEDPHLVRLFGELLRALELGHSWPSLLLASSGLAYLLSRLIHKRQHRSIEAPDVVNKVADAIIYMSEHLDEPLRVSALARIASLSPDYFAQLFKSQTGCSPRDYLHLLRIHKACQLLSSTSLNVKEIASRLGYQDQFHFSRKFKGFQGVSPSEYRGH